MQISSLEHLKMGRRMSRFPETINKLDISEVKKFTEEERLWLVATILLLSEKAGLVAFVRPRLKGKRRGKRVSLPKGLIDLLEACEKQGLIIINRKKLTSNT
jgi:hypothetical protein